MNLSTIREILQAHCTVMPSQPSGVVYVFNEEELASAAKEISTLVTDLVLTKDTHVKDADLSVALYTSLYSGFYKERESKELGELENLSISEFLTFSFANKKTLRELQELCDVVGIQLKPD